MGIITREGMIIVDRSSIITAVVLPSFASQSFEPGTCIIAEWENPSPDQYDWIVNADTA